MKYKLLLVVAMWAYDAHAIRWPSISDPVILFCNNEYGEICNDNVNYKHNGTVFLEQPEIAKPPTSTSLVIRAYGIHCGYGSKVPGYEKPFSQCNWDTQSYSTHAPFTSNCTRAATDRWDLSTSSTCNTDLIWGGHRGAGPGGECVLFGIMVGSILYTPMGAMHANSVANAGNRFCVKPLPPATKCDMQLNDTILDHGVLTPNGSSRASVAGVIDCGQKPVVEFVGGADYTIAPGVNGALNANVDTTLNKIIINSRVTTTIASGGDYSASKTITVSPW
ncbi:hypothetical protein ACLEYI_16665 [Enterobacter ludwigii]|uniref:hypothetical protein n=1 Tax=Enterobacter ludwigii TaxID=299767 RepID=UPI0039751F0F